MNTIRFALIRFWVWILRAISTKMADPADVYFGYRLLLGREPDPSGWRNQLLFIRRGRRRDLVADAFLNSREFQEKRGHTDLTCVDTGRFKIWLDSEDPNVAPGIIAQKVYETHVTAALEKHLKPDSVFVDIGANMGWFTLTAAGIARRVIAIEPNIYNVQLLYRSLLENNFQNVRVLPHAATNRPSILQLHFVHSNGHVSAVSDTTGTPTLVEGRPLDDMLAGIDRVDVMKIDIEGHEPIALQGMSETLARFRPVLLLEFHPAAIRTNAGIEPHTFLDALAESGYSLAVLHQDGTEIGPLDTAGVMAEWETVNRRMKMDGNMHVDLVARPA